MLLQRALRLLAMSHSSQYFGGVATLCTNCVDVNVNVIMKCKCACECECEVMRMGMGMGCVQSR